MKSFTEALSATVNTLSPGQTATGSPLTPPHGSTRSGGPSATTGQSRGYPSTSTSRGLSGSSELEILKALRPLELAFGDIGSVERRRLYADKLASFPVSTIASAVDRLLESHDKAKFPVIGEVLRACREERVGSSTAVAHGNTDWLAERDENIRRRAWEAAHAARTSGSLAREASDGGWDMHLFRYVFCVTSIYLRMQAGLPASRGFDGNELCNYTRLGNSVAGRAEYKRRVSDYLAKLHARAMADEGIGGIPAELLPEWKAMGEAEKRRYERAKGA